MAGCARKDEVERVIQERYHRPIVAERDKVGLYGGCATAPAGLHGRLPVYVVHEHEPDARRYLNFHFVAVFQKFMISDSVKQQFSRRPREASSQESLFNAAAQPHMAS